MLRTALALFLLAAPALAAPVPPPPRLTDATLIGTHTETWGPSFRGPVTFWADGTFRFDDSNGNGTYAGLWWLDGSTLVLIEGRVGPAGELDRATRYEIPLRVDGCGVVGRVGGSGTGFRLARPSEP